MNVRDAVTGSLPTPVRGALAGARKRYLAWSRGRSKPGVVRNHGVSVRIGEHLPSSAVRDLYNGTYEGGELKPLRMFLRPSDVVMEVGTGMGFVTCFAARIVGDQQVFTYEANPANEPHIRENFRLNGLEPRLTIGMLTSSDEPESSFFVEDQFWNSSALRRSGDAVEVRTPNIPLHDEVRRVSPTCLVCDIEGGEHAFFEDCPLDGSLRMILVELHPYLIGEDPVGEVRSRIEAAGFHLVWECEKKLHACYLK